MMMERKKRKALEEAGFWVGDTEDFLELNEEERRLVELRVAISRAVRCLRQKHDLTQQQLAAKLKSSQSRIAKMEAGAGDVSLDLLFRGLFALGGSLSDLTASAQNEVPRTVSTGAFRKHRRTGKPKSSKVGKR